MVAALYFDASVFTTLALHDQGFDAAATVLADATALPTVSDFAWGEFVAVVGARVRNRSFSEPHAKRLVDDARTALLGDAMEAVTSNDIAAATALVSRFHLALKLPDAIHIAIVRRLGVTLLSTDRQQVAAARTLGIACINPTEDKA